MPASQHPNADVRMRGFVEKVSVEAARNWLQGELDRLGPVASEEASLDEAAARVLAVDVVSEVNVPEFERAMMDGFAVRASDTEKASPQSPVPLEVLGDAFPGQTFEGEVTAGKSVRTTTGAPLPPGADAVLPVEQTRTDPEHILAQQPIAAGKNVGSIGEDIRAGEVVLRAGRVLRPQDVGLLSSIGVGRVTVVRRPRVRIVVTGDELLPAGAKPQADCIVDANGPMLAALVRRHQEKRPSKDHRREVYADQCAAQRNLVKRLANNQIHKQVKRQKRHGCQAKTQGPSCPGPPRQSKRKSHSVLPSPVRSSMTS